MDISLLEETTKSLLAPGKGILAADESSGTADKRFDALGIPKSEEMRRKWRELLFTTPGIEAGLSGVILHDETIRQKSSDGIPSRGEPVEPFPELLLKLGIVPGIKVDKGLVNFKDSDEEKISQGLEDLPERLPEYFALGARFTKWRAVIKIGDGSTSSPQIAIPTAECIEANADILAQYAAISQEAGFVPIVEPEVLIDGNHTLLKSEEVLTKTLTALFSALQKYEIHLPGVILKSSMALPGKESGIKAKPNEVAEATLRAFKASVPKELSGIVFLSGGQSPTEATKNLNEIVQLSRQNAGECPWRLTFSYSRALQEPVMQAWMGKDENKKRAQEIFAIRVKETALASEGKYNEGTSG